MLICRFDNERLGVVQGESVVDVTSVLSMLPAHRYPLPTYDPLIAGLPSLRPALEDAARHGERKKLTDVHLLSPVANPGKIMAAPVNYADHLKEATDTAALNHGKKIEEIQKVGIFLKANSSLQGASQGVRLEHPQRRNDHEVELVVVIGKAGRNIERARAHEYIAGYSIGLDMTVRGPEERSMRKSIDTFSVVGPWLVTADEIPDPGRLDMTIHVNGELRQQANTADLLMDIGALIEFSSSFYTVQPGDLLFTGTPAGVGPVQPGDCMVAEISGIGRMQVMVR